MSAAPDELKRTRGAIFAKCRDRGIDADTRHALQRRVTGKESLTDMSLVEMRQVLAALAGRETGRPGRAGGRAQVASRPSVLPVGPHTSKLRALWISAWWLGVVENRTDEALAAWMCRQTGMDAARWATPAQTSACIEALKDWMARDGGVDWSPYARSKKRPAPNPGARILEALWRKLADVGKVKIADPGALHSWVVGFRRAQEPYSTLNASTLNQLIRELGTWLRKGGD